jgi:hypothetical protein
MWIPSGIAFLVLGLAWSRPGSAEAERRVALGRPELAGVPVTRDA